MFSLKNKNALVTGASGGIGEAISNMLYQQGANVCITGTNQEKLDNLNNKDGNIYTSISCDLSEKSNIETLVNNVEQKLGNIDILINNAGITRDQLVMRMKDDDWNKVLETNLYSAFFLS